DGKLDGADHVGHVGEVTTLAAVSQNFHGLILLDGQLKRFKREVGALAGPQTEKNRRARTWMPCWRE
ncbi:MAG: hypothetical protein WEB53_11230, partial [Akkermansiaceae bacterium]